jgi:hypothetical protein
MKASRWTFPLGLLFLVVVVLLSLPYTVQNIQAAEGLVVYDDVLVSGWQDWSYNSITVDYGDTSTVYTGTHSIAVTYDGGWSGLQVGYHSAYLDVSAYDTFRFWIHGGSTGGQPIALVISLESGDIEQTITPVAGTWTQVDVSLLDYSPRDVYSVEWFNNSGSSHPTFYLDEMSFVNTGAPTSTPPPSGVGPALSVNVATDRHPISPYIYGMNFASEDVAEAVRLPVRRWGGQLDHALQLADRRAQHRPRLVL